MLNLLRQTGLRQAGGALAAAWVLISGSSAAATVLYDNGPLNGTVGAFTISAGLAVSDSFSLAGQSVIDSINFGVWTFPGDDTVSTIDWGITTTPDSFSGFMAGGTVTVNNGPSTYNSVTGYDNSVDSFSTGAVSLGAGIYYLVLQNAVTLGGDPVYWDESDGMSSAVQNLIGNLQNYNRPNTTGSESFQIIGTDPPSGAPEPASWALMLVGLAGLGASLRRTRVTRNANVRSRSV